MIDTTLSANGARFYGGPLLNEGTALLERTTVRDNGETIMHMAGDGVLTLLNSTVSGNQSFRIAGSVINWGTTPINIVSSTIADNTDSTGREAGINGISGSVRLMNTIVANPEGRNCVGQVTSLGYNLDSDGSCGLNAVGDLPSSDPLLGPLADHGGPTWTHALLVGSPAIDRIPTKLCSVRTDQRGVERPQPRKGLCDIGSYELER